MTNPLWVVKTRMFTTTANQPSAYRGVLGASAASPPLPSAFPPTLLTCSFPPSLTDGLNQIARKEGIRGLSKGMVLALFGVSNGAIQFMTYEELKRWRQEVKRGRLGPGASEDEVKALVSSGRRRMIRAEADLKPDHTSPTLDQHRVHLDVGFRQARCYRLDLPLSSDPITHTGAPRYFGDHAPRRPLTFPLSTRHSTNPPPLFPTPPFPTASPALTPRRVCEGSTKAWARMP